MRNPTSPLRTSSVSSALFRDLLFRIKIPTYPTARSVLAKMALLLARNDRSGGEAAVGPAFVTKILFFVSRSFAGEGLTCARFSSHLLPVTVKSLMRVVVEELSVGEPALVPAIVTKSPSPASSSAIWRHALPCAHFFTNPNYATVKYAPEPSQLAPEIDR